MDAFAIALNEVLVDTYHNVLRVEEEALKKAVGFTFPSRKCI